MDIKEKKEVDWDSIIEELKIFQGTISEFCEIKKISKSSLYYERKSRNLINRNTKVEPKASFTKIDIKDSKREVKKDKAVNGDQNKKLDNSKINYLGDKNYNTIKIEIGKARIIIDSKDKSTLSFMMKELSSIC